MRTAFLGTSAFAAAILERLAASPHRPALVVTRPDDIVITAHVTDLRNQGWPVRTVPENLDHGYGNAAPLLTCVPQLG